MAEPAAVQVDGAKELAALLRRVADRELNSGLRTAHLAVAAVVANRARPKVPVGMTGRLAASVRPAATQLGATVRMGSAAVPYAYAIHWGRKRGNVGSPPGNHEGPNPIKGRPVIYEEAQRSQAVIAATYESEVVKVIDHALGR